MDKTLVIYTTHQYNDNVGFFIQHGLAQRPDVDFLFVINGSFQLDLPNYTNVRQVNRDNIGHDFGGWSYGLFLDDNYTKYQYYILINSTVRGPFMPIWSNDDWVRCLTGLLTDQVHLVGTSIEKDRGGMNYYYLQSMVTVYDRLMIMAAIDAGVFERQPIQRPKYDVVVHKEVGLTQVALSHGYKIDTLNWGANNYTITKYPYGRGGFYGINLYSLELIFPKHSPNFTTLIEQVDQISHVYQ